MPQEREGCGETLVRHCSGSEVMFDDGPDNGPYVISITI